MMRILLATDSEIMRPKLRAIISEIPNVECVSDVADEVNVVCEVLSTCPDVVVVVLPKFGRLGTGVVPVIRRINPDVIIVVLTLPFNSAGEEVWKEAGATFVFSLTTQLNQFIDCLTALSYEKAVKNNIDSVNDASSNGLQSKENK